MSFITGTPPAVQHRLLNLFPAPAPAAAPPPPASPQLVVTDLSSFANRSDDGITWTPDADPATGSSSISYSADAGQYLTFDDFSLTTWRSADGIAWVNGAVIGGINTQTANQTYPMIACNAAGTRWVIAMRRTRYSDNNGGTWALSGVGTGDCAGIWFSQFSGNFLVASVANGPCRNATGAAAWTASAGVDTVTYQTHGLVRHDSAGQFVTALCYDSLLTNVQFYRSIDGGLNYSASQNFALAGVEPKGGCSSDDGTKAIVTAAAAVGGAYFYTGDAGVTWTYVNNVGDPRYLCSCFVDGFFYLLTANGSIYKTADGVALSLIGDVGAGVAYDAIAGHS